jgi:type IV secretory pathway VirJ component
MESLNLVFEDILNQFKSISNVFEINGNHNFDNERENLGKKILEVI